MKKLRKTEEKNLKKQKHRDDTETKKTKGREFTIIYFFHSDIKKYNNNNNDIKCVEYICESL